jgi:hypothetical protein
VSLAWYCFQVSLQITNRKAGAKDEVPHLENDLVTCKCDIFSSDVAFKLGVDNEVAWVLP